VAHSLEHSIQDVEIVDYAEEEIKKIWSLFVTDFHNGHVLGPNTNKDCADLVNKARKEFRQYSEEDSFLGVVTFIKNRVSL